MSNLSDLLPAGGGGKQVDFVASGTIGNGVTVVLNSDGTVSIVGNTGPLAQESSIQVTTYSPIVAELNSTGDTILVLHRDASNFGTAVAGTISGSTITFGTPVVYYSKSTSFLTLTFDPIANKFLIVYDGKDSVPNPFLFARVVTVTGTSLGFGAQTSLQAFRSAYHKAVYDPTSQKHIVFFKHIDEGTSLYIKYYAGALTVFGTSVSMGALTEVDGDSFDYFPVYDSAASKVAIFYRKTTDNYLRAKVCTVSGTSLSFGAPTVISESYTQDSVTYDSNTNRIVVAYYNSTALRVVVGYISGDTVILGSPTSIYTGAVLYTVCAYNPDKQNIFIAFRDSAIADTGFIIEVAVSGESISAGVQSVFNTDTNYLVSAGYSASTGSGIVLHRKASTNATMVDILKSSSNIASFIGISDSAISDTATGSVTIKGGVSTNVTGLTPNVDYYVQDNGSLSTTVSSVPAGKALSSTSILLKG